MEAVSLDISGLVIIFFIGLQHGLDPDHIAVIDGITLQHHQKRPQLAPWIGALFAMGHGIAVTSIAVLFAYFSHDLQLGAFLGAWFEWLPVVLLILVGSLNLINLLGPNETKHELKGWRTYLLPRNLRENTHPLAVFLIGIIFGLVFDTATQAAAWGIAASNDNGVMGALVVGSVFSLGMIAADTLDSYVLSALLQRAQGLESMRKYRRGLGWFIVFMAYGIATYTILLRFYPSLELDERSYALVGVSFLCLMLLLYGWVLIRRNNFPKYKI
jgi:nickel/cobalt transporter (NiCoT) family protein